jgi:hypothetical protein
MSVITVSGDSGTADAVAGDEGLRAGKDVLADPRRRQVGEDHVVLAEALHLAAVRAGPSRLAWVCTTPLGAAVVPE